MLAAESAATAQCLCSSPRPPAGTSNAWYQSSPTFCPLSCALTKTSCSVSGVLLQKKHLGCSGFWQKVMGSLCWCSEVLTEVAADVMQDGGWPWLGVTQDRRWLFGAGRVAGAPARGIRG